MNPGKGKKGRSKVNSNTPTSEVKTKRPPNTNLASNNSDMRRKDGELENLEGKFVARRVIHATTSSIGPNIEILLRGRVESLHKNPTTRLPPLESKLSFFKENKMGEGQGETNQPRNEDEINFCFPIVDPNSNEHMKNISLTVLPSFQGMVGEDPNTFLF